MEVHAFMINSSDLRVKVVEIKVFRVNDCKSVFQLFDRVRVRTTEAILLKV